MIKSNFYTTYCTNCGNCIPVAPGQVDRASSPGISHVKYEIDGPNLPCRDFYWLNFSKESQLSNFSVMLDEVDSW